MRYLTATVSLLLNAPLIEGRKAGEAIQFQMAAAVLSHYIWSRRLGLNCYCFAAKASSVKEGRKKGFFCVEAKELHFIFNNRSRRRILKDEKRVCTEQKAIYILNYLLNKSSPRNGIMLSCRGKNYAILGLKGARILLTNHIDFGE